MTVWGLDPSMRAGAGLANKGCYGISVSPRMKTPVVICPARGSQALVQASSRKGSAPGAMTREDICSRSRPPCRAVLEVDEEAIILCPPYQDPSFDSIDAIMIWWHLWRSDRGQDRFKEFVGAQRQRRGGCGRASAG